MALTLQNAVNRTAGGGGTGTFQDYTLTQTNGPDNLTEVANAIGNHADWTVTTVAEGNLYREYSIEHTATSTLPKWINVAVDITDNRRGVTVFRFPFSDRRVFFQLMGQNGGTSANINIGLEQGGEAVGTFKVIYDAPINPLGASGQVRPVDLGLGSISGSDPDQQRFAFAGYPSGGSMNTPTEGGPYYTIVYPDAGNVLNRTDFDFLDGGMTGSFSMQILQNSTAANANRFPHILSSRYTLLPGSSMASSQNAPEINVFADTDNTYLPQGAKVAQFPNAFVQYSSTTFGSQYNSLRLRGPNQSTFGTTVVANDGLVVRNYPFNTFRTINLNTSNDTDNVGSQTPTLFLDPTPTSGASFDQRRSSFFRSARGNIFAASGYTVRFREPDGDRHTTHGFVIRQRNSGPLTGGAFDSENASYNTANKDAFNSELPFYAWEIDTDEVNAGSKSGYTLDWYLRPNTTSNSDEAGITPENKVLYTGTYNVWHGVPAGTPAMITKTPYSATGIPDRGVTDQVVQTIPTQFNPANAFPIQWNQRGDVTGARVDYDDRFEAAELLDQLLTVDTLYSTLAFGASEVVQHWSSLSNAQKVSLKHTYGGADGIFKNLVDHECSLVDSVADTTLNISDKDSSAFEFFLGRESPFGNNVPEKGTVLNTMSMSHGAFNLLGGVLDCNSSGSDHAYIQGILRNPLTYASFNASDYSIRDHDRLSGTIEVRNTTSAERFFSFNNSSIAAGASLHIRRDTSVTNSGAVTVVNAPTGTTVEANSGITLANTLIVNRSRFANEAADETNRGRLDVYDTNQNLVAGNVTGTYSPSGVTYTLSEAQYANLNGNAIVVWSRAGFLPIAMGASLGNAGARTELNMVPIAAPTFPNAAPAGVVAVTTSTVNSEVGFDSDSDILTIGIQGAVGGSVPSASQTAELLSTDVFGTEPFNRLCSVSTAALNSIEFFGSAYAVINFDHIRFTPNQAQTQTIGFISGTGSSTRSVPFVSGGATYHVVLPSDSPVGITEAQVRDIVSTQIQTVTDNQRNISLGIPV